MRNEKFTLLNHSSYSPYACRNRILLRNCKPPNLGGIRNVRFHENQGVLEMTPRTAMCCCCTVTPIEGRVPTSH